MKVAQSCVLEDVLRHDVDADVELVGDELEEARRRHLEVEDDGVLVGRLRRIEELLDVGAPLHRRADFDQLVEGVGDILGGERRRHRSR